MMQNRFFSSDSHCYTRMHRLRDKYYDNRDGCCKLHDAATKVTTTFLFDPNGSPRVVAKKAKVQQRSYYALRAFATVNLDNNSYPQIEIRIICTIGLLRMITRTMISIMMRKLLLLLLVVLLVHY
mmetsp:Transcript_4460/g.10755  ORF Transcript_4460/g.10755 Transcript_4460/m.10755 type:complete len:125 (+) Transcript_4460:1137-1511(+)